MHDAEARRHAINKVRLDAWGLAVMGQLIKPLVAEAWMPYSTSVRPSRRRTIVYVDGFNLYYGAVRGTSYKWLDLQRYFTLLRPHHDLILIRYFTALIDGPRRPNQDRFLKALYTLPKVDVILGRFKYRHVECRYSACRTPGRRFFRAKEEKRTDVNIAVYMVDDAYQDRCEQMIVVSGDSDLVPALTLVRQNFPDMRVVVYVPAQTARRGHAVELRTAAHVGRELPLTLMAKAQFPSHVPDGSSGVIEKPADWP